MLSMIHVSSTTESPLAKDTTISPSLTDEGLIVKTHKRRDRTQGHRVPQRHAMRPNQKWSVGFVAQRRPDFRWMCVLLVIDRFAHEHLVLNADNTLSGEPVMALGGVIVLRGAPRWISAENGYEAE